MGNDQGSRVALVWEDVYFTPFHWKVHLWISTCAMYINNKDEKNNSYHLLIFSEFRRKIDLKGSVLHA